MKGIAALFFAYFIWGAMPVYWKALEVVSSFEILGHRVIWSALFTFLLMFGHRNRTIFMDMLKERKKDIFWLDHSGHMAILGEEREQIFSRIHHFIKEKQDE